MIQQDYYLYIGGSEHLMIVDERVLVSDVESGNQLTIRARSLESLLERRIIWNQTILTGNLQNGIKRLLDESIINPTISSRRIPNFIFENSTDSRITAMTVDTQFTGTILYDAIKQLCEERNIGFKIVLNGQNQFVFSLYMGADRSYDQTVNPYVIFSPNFDNIVNSNYLETTKLMRNVALVAGDGEGADRRTVTVGSGTGLTRREVFIDARDISSNDEEGEPIPEDQYNAQLTQRGNEKMTEYIFMKTFEGDVETTQMFVYNKDFFLGDIVQIVNEYGIEATARIVELVFSNSEEGNTVIPSFSVIT